jgi:RimJ/RimL family protein N-acetyltransferase
MLGTENIVFVHASPEDANMFHLYDTLLHAENDIYFQTAKECEKLGTDSIKRFILDSLKSQHSALFILKDMTTREIYAHIHIKSGQTARNAHRAEIYIGVLKQFQGIGIGKKLMEIADFWGKKEGLERLQLSVFSNNIKAIEFYKKLGFIEEGALIDAIKMENGAYYNEVFMGKKIIPNEV